MDKPSTQYAFVSHRVAVFIAELRFYSFTRAYTLWITPHKKSHPSLTEDFSGSNSRSFFAVCLTINGFAAMSASLLIDSPPYWLFSLLFHSLTVAQLHLPIPLEPPSSRLESPIPITHGWVHSYPNRRISRRDFSHPSVLSLPLRAPYREQPNSVRIRGDYDNPHILALITKFSTHRKIRVTSLGCYVQVACLQVKHRPTKCPEAVNRVPECHIS